MGALGRTARRLLAAAAAYVLTVRGAVTLDLAIGRRTRPLGPLRLEIAAPPETVFDVVAVPYQERAPRAMAEKVRVLERGDDMVLAAHFTPVGQGLTATTVETVRFERPERVTFRLVRGPVPHVRETFELTASEAGTDFVYTGELGTDLWGLGRLWGNVVARSWERTVADSLADVKKEAERRAAAG